MPRRRSLFPLLWVGLLVGLVGGLGGASPAAAQLGSRSVRAPSLDASPLDASPLDTSRAEPAPSTALSTALRRDAPAGPDTSHASSVDADAPDGIRYADVASSGADPHLTLDGWASERRIQVLDRRHAYGDRTYDRGYFRYITPDMDREYALDMISYRFNPEEAYAWQQIDNGIRIRAGSIVRAEWALVTDFKHRADIGDGHTLSVDGRLQQDPQAQRSLLEFTYDWEFADRHHAGVRHTFTQYKPDIDPSFYYQFGDARAGHVRAEITILDAYHDVIFSSLGVSEKDEDFTRNYRRNPYLLQLALATPRRYRVRGEVRAAWQPESELAYTGIDDPDVQYRDEQALHYAGALLEVDAGPVTTGLILVHDRSALARVGERTVTSDYTNEQRMKRGGGFVMGAWGDVRGEAWFFLEDYYDRQHGSDFSLSTIGRAMDWTEYRKNLRLRVFYTPNPTGWYTGVEYISLTRRLGEAPWIMGNEWTRHWYELAPTNSRGALLVGYRFARGAVSFGVNYDVDGDETYKSPPDYAKKRFDNGFFRFSLTW